MAIGTKAAEGGVSIRPSEAVAMGLLDDFDGTITDAKFMKFDYNGKGKAVLSLAVEIDPDGAEKFVQQYSCGEAALKNFVILTGNTKVKAVSPTVTGLPDSSNCIKFLSSLVSANFPEDLMSDDVSALVGTKAHFRRVANENKFSGEKKEGERDNRILLVEKVLALPGTEAAAPVKAAPAGAPAKKKAAPVAVAPAPTNGAVVNGGVDAKASEFIMSQIVTGPQTKQALAQAAFAALNGDTDRNAVIAKVANDAFLGAEGSPWTYDGSTVSLGG
jgi:hypothetical protein